jgi:hypothetical protein
MSGVISRMPMGRAGLSVAFALVALVLTSFFDARPDGRGDVGGAVRFDGPASGPWCARMDGLAADGCRYPTFEQCLAAVSTGVCRPNPAAVITDEGPYRTYRSVYL